MIIQISVYYLMIIHFIRYVVNRSINYENFEVFSIGVQRFFISSG